MGLAAEQLHERPAARLLSRRDLTAFMMQVADAAGADSYMLLSVVHEAERATARVIASNWTYDAIELAGRRLIANLAEKPAAAPGARPHAIVPGEAPRLAGIADGEETRLLDALGHGEIFSLRLNVGRLRCFLILSAAEPGLIDQASLTAAQLSCCYALSQAPDLIAASTDATPLSERERECLAWVSEGKTTDEVALILGLSANTVNCYVTNAMQKLSATSRVMAVAAAIRSGAI